MMLRLAESDRVREKETPAFPGNFLPWTAMEPPTPRLQRRVCAASPGLA